MGSSATSSVEALASLHVHHLNPQSSNTTQHNGGLTLPKSIKKLVAVCRRIFLKWVTYTRVVSAVKEFKDKLIKFLWVLVCPNTKNECVTCYSMVVDLQ